MRFDSKEGELVSISTKERRAENVSAIRLRGTKSIFYTEQTQTFIEPAQLEFFAAVIEEESSFRKRRISNFYDWKTPVALGIADSDPERVFIRHLIDSNF